MKLLKTSADLGSGGRAPELREYLIDHCRVSFHDESRWHCGCREFAAAEVCRHTREAAGMRAAQDDIRGHVRSGKSGLRGLVPRRA